MSEISLDGTRIITFHGTVMMEMLAKKSAALPKKTISAGIHKNIQRICSYGAFRKTYRRIYQ